MYRNRHDLSFTTAYTGVVQANVHAPSGHYENLKGAQPAGIGAWYYEHSNGTLWIATGSEHAEPVTDWLHDAHLVFRCTTMLAAVLKNGVEQPPDDAYLFQIHRHDVLPVHEELLRDCFTIYLPHCDEFLIFTPFRRYWNIEHVSRLLPARTTVNTRLSFDPPPQRPPREGNYDPIEAQIREVLGSVSETARQAAADLVGDWKEILGEPIPADIRSLQREIENEKQEIIDARNEAKKTGADVSSKIDGYARSLQNMRHTAFDLRARIRDYEWPPRQHATYESVATPLMLRALQRYAADLASQLGIASYLLPLVGEEFTTSSMFLPTPAQGGKTAVIEIPPEIRLRLGALPMIAHPVSHLNRDKIEEVASAISRISAHEHQWITELRPHFVVSRGSDARIEYDRYRERIKRAEREIAADLLATAVAGPPYVFAMARFAIGNLGEPVGVTVPAADRPPFRLRLAICLALLEILGIPTHFQSRYYHHGQVELPPWLRDAIEKATEGVRKTDEERITYITSELKDGRIVHAYPTEILTALWRAVAGRTGYLNEIAALVSVATTAIAGAP